MSAQRRSSSRSASRKPLVAGEEGDGIEPRFDRERIGQRRGEIIGQEPRAGAGLGAIDRREEAAVAIAGQALGQFEIAPRRRIDLHHLAAAETLGRGSKAGSFPCCVSST